MNQLEWQNFQGTTKEFFKLRGKILNHKGEPRKKYIDMEGYAVFADKYYQGHMTKTFINVSAVLEKREMNQLEWQNFQGTTKEFFKLRGKILNHKGEPRKKYIDMEGYAVFADKYYQGHMTKTFVNVSAVLEKREMNQLEWQSFQGTTKEFFKLRGKILNHKGEPRKKYIDMEGYAVFADKYYQGHMTKTFINVSAVLGRAKAMRELGLDWKNFQGTTAQYRELKELFDTKSIEKLRYRKGQEFIAETIFKGNIIRTYRNVSILREELLGSWEAFKELNW